MVSRFFRIRWKRSETTGTVPKMNVCLAGTPGCWRESHVHVQETELAEIGSLQEPEQSGTVSSGKWRAVTNSIMKYLHSGYQWVGHMKPMNRIWNWKFAHAGAGWWIWGGTDWLPEASWACCWWCNHFILLAEDVRERVVIFSDDLGEWALCFSFLEII